MCGEIDEQVLVGQELLDRARFLTRKMHLPEAGAGDRKAPRGLAEAEGRAAYMERIFHDGLARALDDIARAEDDEAVDALAAQSIALARLAGFLAGQLPPEADLFRAVIEAAAAGSAESKDMAETEKRRHDHHHDHHHHHH